MFGCTRVFLLSDKKGMGGHVLSLPALFFLACILFSVDAFAACLSGTGVARFPGADCGSTSVLRPSDHYLSSGCYQPYNVPVSGAFTGCTDCYWDNGANTCHYSFACCQNQCEADSLACNGTWYHEGNECYCLGDECKDTREDCQRLGGHFTGTTDPIRQCCIGHCDLCNSPTSESKYNRTVVEPCCNAGYAPPPIPDVCSSVAQGGCGVTVADVCTVQKPCYCVEPDDPNFLSYRALYCDVPESSSSGDGGSSSSGGGSSGSGSSDSQSSSSGGGSSGSGNGEDWEYDYNDSLHKIIVNTAETADGVKELVFCFTLGDCKTDMSTTNSLLSRNLHLDSLIYEFIQDRIDSSLKLDQQQIDVLHQIATQGLPGDSTLWRKTDSATMVIYNAFAENMDTTSIALARLADSLGVSTDSIIKHLDSIWKRLEPDVQDSILKYQKYATDNFDSVLYGKGKGFSLIDSLIDTSVKYFKDVVTAIDTMSMNLELGDSLYDSLHYVIDGINFIPNGVGIALGYGDTATSTLRIDLQGIRNGLDSGLGNVAGQFYGVYDSLGNLRGAVDALGNSIGDSIHALRGDFDRIGNRFGDSLGVLHGVLGGLGDSAGNLRGVVGGIGDSLTEWYHGSGTGGMDTSGNGVGHNIDGFLDGTDVDDDADVAQDMYDAAVNDTALDRIFDTTGMNIAMDTFELQMPDEDSLKDVLEQSIEEDYDSLARLYEGAFDTLKDEMQLINWDSVILAPLGQKVPDINACPDDCFSFKSDGAPSYMGSFNLNFGICDNYTALGGSNVLVLIRLILRIIVAIHCVYIGAWFIAERK